MANASIRFSQGATVGAAGQALLGVAGTLVTVANDDDTNVVEWTFIVNAVPPTSSVPVGTVQSGSSPSWTFTPDVADCYLITLQTKDNIGVVRSDTRAFGVLRTSGRIVPPFAGDAGSLNFQNAPWSNHNIGWDPVMRAWLDYVDGIGGSVDNPVIVASGTTQLVRPAGGFLYVPVNLAQAAGNVTVKAWNSARVGDRIAIGDEALQAGHSQGGIGAYDLFFDGSSLPVVQWGSQTPSFGSTTGVFRFAGDVVILRCTQLQGVNSNNPFWFPLQGQ